VGPRLLLARRQALTGVHPLDEGGLDVANGTANLDVGRSITRILAFASQELLSLKRWAASFGVSTTGMIVAGFSDGARPRRLEFVMIWIPR
jgi:hypothetical protein